MGVVTNFLLVLRTILSIIKTCYRVVRYHPSVLFVILFFYLLYRFVPSVFNLLLSSFPLFTCTVALIALLVALGHGTDTHQTRWEADEQKHQSSPKTKHVKDKEPIIEKDKKTCEETTNDVKTLATDINEKPVGSIRLAGGLSRRQKSTKRVSFSPINFESSAYGTTTADYKSKEILEDGKLEIDKPKGEISENQRDASDSSQDPSLEQNEGTAVSLSSHSVPGPTSCHAESSSSTALVVDINPVTTDAPSQPVLLSIGEFDGAPEESDRSNEDGLESEAEKNGNKSASKWTEDDEKNLMDLGESEIERNQRLESLMARRRARKKMLRMVAEKNLVDLDHNDPPIQIAPLSVIKSNPFDHSTENEIPGLPPIPGSAPSVLIPRANPFDLPYDPQEERPNLTGDSFHEEFMNVIQKDIFCRHESFCYGSTSYLGGLKQDKSDNNIRSYSVIEDMGSPEQRPMGAPSDSTSSLGTEVELRSLVPDQEDEMKPIEEQSAQECELMPPIDQSANFVEGTTQSPEADVVEIHPEERSEAYMKPDIVEEKYIGLSSSSSSSSSEFSKNEIQSQAIELNRDDSALNDYDPKSGMTVKVKDNSQPYESVYDSSPSAIEKRTIEESLFCEDKGVVLTSVLSIASDMQVEVSEANSPSASSERNTAFTDEELLNYNENVRSCNSSVGEDLWAASPDLHTVDEIESKSNGVTEISDLAVINAGLFGACTTDANTGIPIEQQPVLNPVNSNPPPCPSETESNIEGLVSQASSSSTEPEVVARVPQVDWKENVAPIASSSSARQLPHESLIVQPSRDGDHHNEAQEPPISSSKEHSFTDPLAVDSKTNSALLEEPSMQGSVNQSPSSNAVKELHSQVYKLNLEETADTTAATSSLAQPSLENLTNQTSVDGNHLDEKQEVSFKSTDVQEVSFKSTEDENTIKNVKDPPAVESYPTSSLMCEPLTDNQNSLSSTEPEMHNHVEQLVLEENVEPNPSSSSLSQVPPEEFVYQPPINNEHHEEAKEPSTKPMEEGDISKDVNDSISTDFKSTSSVGEPIKEEMMNESSSSAVEAEIMSNQVHLLNLEENVDPEASSSSVSQLPSEKSVVHPSMNNDHHEETMESPIISTKEGDIIKDVNDSVSTDSKSTSSVDEPIKEGVMNENSSSAIEPEIMSYQVHSLKLEENVDPGASSSSVEQLPSEKSVHPSMNNDHHEETQQPSIISTEEGNLSKRYQHGMHPVTTDSHSTSSVMNEPIKEGLMNRDPSSSAEKDMHNQDLQLNLVESGEQTVSGSSLTHFPVENSMVQTSVDSDHPEAAQESSMQSPEEDNIINDVKDRIIVEEEKSKSVKDAEGDNQELIERQVDLPETAVTPLIKEQAFEANQNFEQKVAELAPKSELDSSGVIFTDDHLNEEETRKTTDSGTIQEKDVEADRYPEKDTSTRLHDEQLTVTLTPETKVESVMVSFSADHLNHGGRNKTMETATTQKQDVDGNLDQEHEMSKLLHNDQKVGQASEEKIQEESSTVGSANYHADQGSHMMTSEGATVQSQDFGGHVNLENKSSNHLHDVKEVLQLQPEIAVESGRVSSSVVHTNDQESKKITDNVATQEQGTDANCDQESHETMEHGAQQSQDSEADQGKEKESTGHLHNEDVQLKPNTTRESGAVSSADHSNEHTSYEKTESGTQSKQPFVANPDLEKETSEDSHNGQQAGCLKPETKLESSNLNLDHGSSKLLEAMESDFNQNTESAYNENHQHLVKEIASDDLENEVATHQPQKPGSTTSANIVDHHDTYGHEDSNQKSNAESGSVEKKLAFGGNLPLKNIIFKNLIEEEVWLTPKTTLEAITPRAPITPKAAELELHYHRNHSNDHGASCNIPEMMENRTREETHEPSKPLQVTEVVTVESVDHGSENQDFDEKDTSKPRRNEHDIHHPQQVTADKIKFESGEHAMSSVMETGPAKKELRFEPNNLRNMIYKNLQQEEEVWLTPRTEADHYHNYQHDNESSNVQTNTSTPTMRKTESDSAEAEKKVDFDEGNHHPQENEASDSKTLDCHENVVDESSNVQTSASTPTMRKTEGDSEAAEKKVDFDEGNHNSQENEASDSKTLDDHEDVVDESSNVQTSISTPAMRKTGGDSEAAEKKVDFDEGNHHPQENETVDSKTLDYHEYVVDESSNVETSTSTPTMRKTEGDSEAAEKKVDFDEGNHHPHENETIDAKTLDYHENVVDESSNVETSTSTPTMRKTEGDSEAAEKKVDFDEGNHHPQENETIDSKTLDYHENVVDESSNVETSTSTPTMRKTEGDSEAAEKKVDFDEGNHHPQENETIDSKTLDCHENVVDESSNVQTSTSTLAMRKNEGDPAAAEKKVDFVEGNHHPQEYETSNSKTLDYHENHENIVDDKNANSTTSTIVKKSMDE
ncbi:hypothetical protein C5167_003709 [Papaver somniferum]|uniref:Uncharacterized protein n=1 Tax=Papaver somniferum TaxID=3469 RepID=A0A4Y7L5A1_PAPSO|nr:hypothetical protein C5167_003709 [Papaver somniferum]